MSLEDHEVRIKQLEQVSASLIKISVTIPSLQKAQIALVEQATTSQKFLFSLADCFATLTGQFLSIRQLYEKRTLFNDEGEWKEFCADNNRLLAHLDQLKAMMEKWQSRPDNGPSSPPAPAS